MLHLAVAGPHPKHCRVIVQTQKVTYSPSADQFGKAGFPFINSDHFSVWKSNKTRLVDMAGKKRTKSIENSKEEYVRKLHSAAQLGCHSPWALGRWSGH
jgi:hypothetical protein